MIHEVLPMPKYQLFIKQNNKKINDEKNYNDFNERVRFVCNAFL